MYKKWQRNKIPLLYIVILLIILVVGLIIVEITKEKTRYYAYKQQVEAAKIMKRSIDEISKKRNALNIYIDKNIDPNKTGLIGKEISKITTTLGNLEAKRTTTNPDFAALLVRYFKNANLKNGDVIAIGASGSFPSLILATLTAAKTLKLKPLLIYSFGSSMYGANIPEFTFLDMLSHLNKNNILDYKPIAVSFGGNNDRADSLIFADNRNIFFSLAEKTKIPLIYENNLENSIKKRMSYYENTFSNKKVKCFINIGGASVNYGNTEKSLNFPNGLVRPFSYHIKHEEKGLIFEYIEKNIPVINLINIRSIAKNNGISIDPVPLPKVSYSDVYYEIVYSNKIIIAILFFTILFLICSLCLNKNGDIFLEEKEDG
jgi:poly-gamma-glutamate system protein